jgi:tetratricopeptide (TPR) repeat protein
VNWSQAARQAGHPARAEHCARQALALAPTHRKPTSTWATPSPTSTTGTKAERQYQTATLCAPGWIEPALNLGNPFDRQSRFAEAAACLDTLSHSKPAADWRVFSALGRARSMLGDTAAARDAYARALALNPRAPRPTAATCIT